MVMLLTELRPIKPKRCESTSRRRPLTEELAHALVKNPTEQLDIWFQTWESLYVIDRKATRTTWATTVGKFMKGESLARPRGPLEATISTLLFLGWRPAAPDYWVLAVDENGAATEWVELKSGGYTRFQIIARAMHDAQTILWKRAAKHSYGNGLETGNGGNSGLHLVNSNWKWCSIIRGGLGLFGLTPSHQ